MNKKLIALAFIMIAPMATGFELIRVTVNQDSGLKSVCKVTDIAVSIRNKVDGIEGERIMAHKTDNEKMDKLVKAAHSLDEKKYQGSKAFTNWWVKGYEQDDFKLIRHSPKGGTAVQAPYALTLAKYMGYNCSMLRE